MSRFNVRQAWYMYFLVYSIISTISQFFYLLIFMTICYLSTLIITYYCYCFFFEMLCNDFSISCFDCFDLCYLIQEFFKIKFTFSSKILCKLFFQNSMCKIILNLWSLYLQSDKVECAKIEIEYLLLEQIVEHILFRNGTLQFIYVI